MITFICCSINPTLASELEKNIAQTAGVPFEFVAFDNRERGWGICKVYNDCAKDAKYDYLCFLHEDVRFQGQDWAAKVIAKLSEADCGVIGFAGSNVKYNMPSSWGCLMEASRTNVIQHRRSGEVSRDIYNPNNEEFAQVITLDGLCLFMRRDVWSECRFDEERLSRFHCYDLDIAINVAQRHKNYVCFTVDIEHLSPGAYNQDWIDATKTLQDKWESVLPMCTPEWSEYIKHHDMTHNEYLISRETMKKMKNIYSPSKIACSYFAKYWHKSHYAWLIMLKLLTDRLKDLKQS